MIPVSDFGWAHHTILPGNFGYLDPQTPNPRSCTIPFGYGHPWVKQATASAVCTPLGLDGSAWGT